MNNGISHKNEDKIYFLVKLHHNMAITEKILIDSSFIFSLFLKYIKVICLKVFVVYLLGSALTLANEWIGRTTLHDRFTYIWNMFFFFGEKKKHL